MERCVCFIKSEYSIIFCLDLQNYMTIQISNIPMQSNGNDCGIFVCMVSYAGVHNYG